MLCGSGRSGGDQKTAFTAGRDTRTMPSSNNGTHGGQGKAVGSAPADGFAVSPLVNFESIAEKIKED
jgi:hypothetical protein